MDSLWLKQLFTGDNPCDSIDELLRGRFVDMDAIGREVDRNYDYFQRNLATFVEGHRGEYALLRDRRVVDFFDDPGKAAQFAAHFFGDEIYSIQEVTDAPIDLGLYSYASN